MDSAIAQMPVDRCRVEPNRFTVSAAQILRTLKRLLEFPDDGVCGQNVWHGFSLRLAYGDTVSSRRSLPATPPSSTFDALRVQGVSTLLWRSRAAWPSATA